MAKHEGGIKNMENCFMVYCCFKICLLSISAIKNVEFKLLVGEK
jgi:hypothetical protein